MEIISSLLSESCTLALSLCPSRVFSALGQQDSGAGLSPSCSDRFVKRECPDMGQRASSEVPGGPQV